MIKDIERRISIVTHLPEVNFPLLPQGFLRSVMLEPLPSQASHVLCRPHRLVQRVRKVEELAGEGVGGWKPRILGSGGACVQGYHRRCAAAQTSMRRRACARNLLARAIRSCTQRPAVANQF